MQGQHTGCEADIMVFYFTGTGNSQWAAWQIGQAHDERVVSIAECVKTMQRYDEEHPGATPAYSLFKLGLGLPTT